MSESTWSFSQIFAQEFQASSSDLESRISSAKQLSSASQEVLQELSAGLAKLVKNLSDATGSLPSYDQRKYEEGLKELETALSELRVKWTPKQKFSFKRKAGTSTPPSLAASSNKISQNNTRKEAVAGEVTTNPKLSSRSREYITTSSLSLPSAQHDLTISDLDNCIVNLIPADTSSVQASQLDISALHIRNLTDTVLVLPPINGSVLIHDLSRCTIVLGCHQFRMHTSHNVNVYLLITSNPIIEQCTGIRFSGYPTITKGLPNERPSQHLSVMDFSHIRSTPSPNWSVLDDDQVVSEWKMRDKDDGELGRTLEQLLPS